MAELFLVLVFVGALLLYAWRRIKSKAQVMGNLLSRGTPVTGRIIKVERKRLSRTHTSFRVRYAFTTSGGAAHERELEVAPKEFENYREGQELEIVYDPANPTDNAIKSAVDSAREAMQKAQSGGMR